MYRFSLVLEFISGAFALNDRKSRLLERDSNSHFVSDIFLSFDVLYKKVAFKTGIKIAMHILIHLIKCTEFMHQWQPLVN